ncbi:MAG: hypothetical protein ABEJ92_06550 [Halobacteriales archaeon]
MGVVRSAAIVLLVALLAVDLAAANALVAADRTVLNPGFVTTTLEEENAYSQAEPLVVESFPLGELGSTDGGSPPLPVDPDAVAGAALDPAYLESQVEPNIERALAYLHGNADELQLAVDLEPVKGAVADAVEAELANASPTELVGVVGGDGRELTLERNGVTIDLVTAARMAENASVFRSERAAFRADIRERVLDRLVDRAFRNATDDERLALVIDDYDPSDYTEAEKARMVEEREPEIRAAIRERIESADDGRLADAVDDRLAAMRESVRTDVANRLNESLGDADPAIARPMADLVLVAVDGYLADTTYEAYRADFQAAADDLAAGLATVIETRLDEQAPDRVDLDEQLDQTAMENLEQARRTVVLIDWLAIGLPLLALLLIGLVYLASRSVAVTAVGAGVGLVLGGLPGLVGAALLPARLRTVLLSGDAPPAVADLGLALAGQVTDAVFVQSGVVVALGVVAVAAGLALRFGVIGGTGGPAS